MANKNHDLWDEFEVTEIHNYIKLDEPGSKVGGDILNIEKAPFTDKVKKTTTFSPQLTLMCDDGVERILTCSNVDLKNQVVTARPKIGDRIVVEMIGQDPFSQLKRYSVDVTHRTTG